MAVIVSANWSRSMTPGFTRRCSALRRATSVCRR